MLVFKKDIIKQKYVPLKKKEEKTNYIIDYPDFETFYKKFEQNISIEKK
jgi:hypothetical protein